MKQRIIRLAKKYNMVYAFYRVIMTVVIFILKLFCRKQQNKIVFVCNGGRKYGDNIAPIYLQILKDESFADWTFVWAFHNPEKYALPDSKRTKICKIDTITFFVEAITSKCWITNTSLQRGLNFKRRNIVYINTWHGVPMKLLGFDNTKGYSFNNKDAETFDLMIAAGNYDLPIMKSAFQVKNDNVKVTGYPRNDILFTCNREDIKKRTKEELGVPCTCKVILYAPTYRDFNKTTSGDVIFELPISVENFSNTLGDYRLWVRMHELIDIKEYGDANVIDVTGYESNYNLLLAADILISDYSGIIFEYALLEKPIIIFGYDYEEYIEKRGLYVDIERDFPFHFSRTEYDLLEYIKNMDYEEECEKTRNFKKKYNLIEGNATGRVVDEIRSLLHSDMSSDKYKKL